MQQAQTNNQTIERGVSSAHFLFRLLRMNGRMNG